MCVVRDLNPSTQYLFQNKKRSSRHSRHLSPPKVTAVPSAAPSTSSASSARWECHACTYLNKARLDICEMCGKSR